MLDWILEKFPSVQALLAERDHWKREHQDSEKLRLQLTEKLRPKSARLTIERAMSEEAIEESLAGTENNSVMRAVQALVMARIVSLGDLASDRPRSVSTTHDGSTVPGYTAEERMHDAGGAANLAELLAKLQDLAKPKPADEAEERRQ